MKNGARPYVRRSWRIPIARKRISDFLPGDRGSLDTGWKENRIASTCIVYPQSAFYCFPYKDLNLKKPLRMFLYKILLNRSKKLQVVL
jgi:hypothetical protein